LPPYRVVIHGLPHFCTKLERLLQCEGWDVRYHACQSLGNMAALARDLSRADLAYTWGGRVSLGKFLQAARWFGAKSLVMLWSGSDIFYAQEQVAAGQMHPWIASKTHWAVSPWIADEARSLGLKCEFVQASFVEPVAAVAPLPEKFAVLCYVPNREKAALYGWEEIKAVAQALPDVEFRIVGLLNGETLDAPANVKLGAWAKDLAPQIRQATVVWRPVRHDGLSFTVLESLAEGRHVIYSYPFVGCVQAVTADAARREIERLLALHRAARLGVNAAGVEAIAREFTPSIVRANLLRRWEEIILAGRAARDRGVGARASGKAAEEASR
jgi:hypothetical protein